jgi:lysyl-tRNA synthetase class II
MADFLGVKGTLFKSKTGELTLAATELTFLGKALRGLPGKFAGDDAKVKLTPEQVAKVKQAADEVMAAINAAPHDQREKVRTDALAVQTTKLKDDANALKALPGAVNKAWAESQALADTEERYRRRYVDLLSNPGVRDTFKKRTKLVKFIRDFLDARDFLEVETPMMHSLVSGAAARPFKTHHNTYDIPLFMRIAPELHLKRLVVGGFDRVYEINRNFRNEGVSTRHNPEFTMLEFYQAYATYEDLMDLTEQMISEASVAVNGTSVVKYGEHTIDFKKGWPRIPMTEAIRSRVKDLTEKDFSDVETIQRYGAIHTPAASAQNVPTPTRSGHGRFMRAPLPGLATRGAEAPRGPPAPRRTPPSARSPAPRAGRGTPARRSRTRRASWRGRGLPGS